MSERNEPAYPRHEEALAAALHAEAETVRTAGDGLVRIRARVERRRMRNRLLVPIATTAAVAATVTAVVATGLLAGQHKADHIAVAPPTSSPAAASPSSAVVTSAASKAPLVTTIAPSATTASASVVVATTSSAPVTTAVVASVPPGPVPVWPFADKAAADAWQATAANGSDAWHLDARATAERFVASVVAQLKLPKQGVLNGTTHLGGDGSATVDVTRNTGNAMITLGTVRLSHWSTGAAAPWGVINVTSPTKAQFPLTITAPVAEATVGSPLPVTVDLIGVENDDYFAAISAGGGSVSAVQRAVLGTGATVTLASGVPASGRGYVVVADGSSGQGAFGLSRLAVTPVRFGAAIPEAATYVAIQGGRLHVYDLATSAEMHPLAGDAAGVTQVAVSGDRQWVYYLTGGDDCATGVLSRTRLDGTGAPEKVDTGAGRVTTFAIGGPHAEHLAYVTDTCTGSFTLHSSVSGAATQLSFPSSPPRPESLALSADGTTLSAYIRSGTLGSLDTFTLPLTSLSAGRPVPGCAAPGAGECLDAVYTPDGDLVYLRTDGQRATVVRVSAGKATELFHVAAAFGGTVDLDPTGSKVLLTDGLGHAWSWTGSGPAKALPRSMTGASW